MLLASQVALSFALLMAAVQFARTLQKIEQVDAGFRPDGVVVADVNFSGLRLPSDRAVAFRAALLERLRAIPGAAGATESLYLPLRDGNWNNRAWMDGTDAADARVAMRNMVGTEYFARCARRRPGREFADRDMQTAAPKVAT